MKETSPAYFRSIYETVSELLNEKRAEEDTLEAQLEQVRQEIVGLEQVLNAAAPFTSDAIKITDIAVVECVAGLSLADAVRKVLEHNPQARTPRGIRDSLAASGYDLSQHNNALASTHGVLKRMADSGEIERIEVNGKTRYRSKSVRITPSAAALEMKPFPPEVRIEPAPPKPNRYNVDKRWIDEKSAKKVKK